MLRETILAHPQAGEPLNSGNTAGNTQGIPKQLFCKELFSQVAAVIGDSINLWSSQQKQYKLPARVVALDSGTLETRLNILFSVV